MKCMVCEEYRKYVEHVAQQFSDQKPAYMNECIIFAILSEEDYKNGWRIHTDIKFSVENPSDFLMNET